MQARALVTAKWLANIVKSNGVGPDLRILDSSWYLPMMKRDGKKEFAKSHIPGASHFDIDECVNKTSRFDHSLPSEQYFAEYVGSLGIGNSTRVVVYDASDWGAFTSTRVWWMFRLFGHPQVSVLDGGFRNWVKEGHPVSSEYTKPERTEFKPGRVKKSWVKTFEEVRDNIVNQQFQVVDVRPYGRFRGLEPEPREGVQPGHIPGSKCMPFFDFLDEDGMMLSPERMRLFFQRSGVDLEKPIVGTCGSGVTACHMVLGAHLCGHPDASVYVGSWYEWYTKAAPELVASDGKNRQG